MRAAVLREFQRPLEISDVAEPQVAHDEVLIRVRATGLCGTDLKLNSGALSHVRLPRIPGHEVAGEVVEDAHGLAAGQRVACYMYESCGDCRTCRLGFGSVCPKLVRIGVERDGGLAEYMAVRRDNALPIGPGVSFGAAAVAMDSVLTPWCGLLRRAQLREAESVVVVGAGGLGLSAVQIARGVGARVAVVDPEPDHLEHAVALGAEVAVAPGDAAAVRDWSGGGTDVALDTSGAPSGFRTAVDAVRARGRVVVCGYQVDRDYAFESSRMVLEEISLLGARVGSREDARAVLDAIDAGWITPTIMAELPLQEVNAALDRLSAAQVVGRLVIGVGA